MILWSIENMIDWTKWLAFFSESDETNELSSLKYYEVI